MKKPASMEPFEKRTLLIQFNDSAYAFIDAVARYGGVSALHVEETEGFGIVTYKTETLAENISKKLKSDGIYSFKVIVSDYQPDRSCLYKGQREAKEFEQYGIGGRRGREYDASLRRSVNNRMGARNHPHDDGSPPCVSCGEASRFSCICGTRYCGKNCHEKHWVHGHCSECQPSSRAGKNLIDGRINEPFPENSVENIRIPRQPDFSIPPPPKRQGTPLTDHFFTLPFASGMTCSFRVLSCHGNVCWLGFPTSLDFVTGIERGNAPLIQPSPNTIALGFSQSRRGWLRCYVKRRDGDQFSVVFVDTGDMETITQLAELPQRYFTSPAMAFPCFLYQPSGELLAHFKILAEKEEDISLFIESKRQNEYVLRYSFKGIDVVLNAQSWKSYLEGHLSGVEMIHPLINANTGKRKIPFKAENFSSGEARNDGFVSRERDSHGRNVEDNINGTRKSVGFGPRFPEQENQSKDVAARDNYRRQTHRGRGRANNSGVQRHENRGNFRGFNSGFPRQPSQEKKDFSEYIPIQDEQSSRGGRGRSRGDSKPSNQGRGAHFNIRAPSASESVFSRHASDFQEHPKLSNSLEPSSSRGFDRRDALTQQRQIAKDVPQGQSTFVDHTAQSVESTSAKDSLFSSRPSGAQEQSKSNNYHRPSPSKDVGWGGRKPSSTPQQQETVSEKPVEEVIVKHRKFNECEKFEVIITEVSLEEGVFLQLWDTENISRLEKLNQEMTNSCKSDSRPHRPKVGEFILGLYEEDWYRAKVLTASGDSYKVTFVDYGNSETLSPNNIRQLPKKFGDITAFGFWARLHGFEVLPAEVVDKLNDIIQFDGPGPMSVHAQISNVEPVSVQLIVNGTFINDVLETGGEKGSKNAGSTQQAPRLSSFEPCPPTDVIIKERNLEVGQTFKVIIAAASLEKGVFLQYGNDEDVAAFEELCSKLTESCTINSKPHRPQVGEFVAGKYEGDWFRARVMKSDADSFSVMFVDYGNIETLSPMDIRPLPNEFGEKESFGFSTRLHGLKMLSAAKKSMLDEIMLSSLNIEVKAEVKEIQPVSVRLIANGVCFNDLPEDDQLNVDSSASTDKNMTPDAQNRTPDAQNKTPDTRNKAPDVRNTTYNSPNRTPDTRNKEPNSREGTPVNDNSRAPLSGFEINLPKFNINETFTVLVLKTASDGRVFFQSFKNHSEINSISTDLNAFYASNAKPHDPCVGDFVAARFLNDWYRGKVEEKVGDHYQIFFVDYGSTEIVESSEIRPLPTKISVKKPAFGFWGHLEGVKTFSAEDKEYLNKLQKESIRVEIKIHSVSPLSVLMRAENKCFNTEVATGAKNRGGTTASSSRGLSRVDDSVASQSRCKDADLRVGQRLEVNIEDIGVDRRIFLQCNSDEIVRNTLELNDYCKAASPSQNPKAGDFVAGFYDGDWYRAKVLDVGNNVEVEFFDYGNCESLDASQIKPLPEKFLQIPSFGFWAHLNGCEKVSNERLMKLENVRQSFEKVKVEIT